MTVLGGNEADGKNIAAALREISETLQYIGAQLSKQGQGHLPQIAPTREGYWGVFCGACSDEAGDYVYPCMDPRPDAMEWPPARLMPVPAADQ